MAQNKKKYFNFSFLKSAELFLASSFLSNFSGGRCYKIAGYDNLTNYIKCGLGDLIGGLTAPFYNKNIFFSFFTFATVFPLSKKAKDSTLKSSFNGSINNLYFIKKQKDWSWMLSSNHSLAYNHFTNTRIGEKGQAYNNPFDSSQTLSLIFKQHFNNYLPTNISFYLNYNIVINTENTYWLLQEIKENTKKTHGYFRDTSKEHEEDLSAIVNKNCPKNNLGSVILCGSRYQEMALGLSSSWKLDQRMYLTLSIKWKDLIKLYNPHDEKIRSSQAVSFGLHKWFFTLRASYSF